MYCSDTDEWDAHKPGLFWLTCVYEIFLNRRRWISSLDRAIDGKVFCGSLSVWSPAHVCFFFSINVSCSFSGTSEFSRTLVELTAVGLDQFSSGRMLLPTSIKRRVWRGIRFSLNSHLGGVFLDRDFVDPQPAWSASRTNKWGYGQMAINQTHLHYAFHRMVESDIYDEFWLVK